MTRPPASVRVRHETARLGARRRRTARARPAGRPAAELQVVAAQQVARIVAADLEHEVARVPRNSSARTMPRTIASSGSATATSMNLRDMPPPGGAGPSRAARSPVLLATASRRAASAARR